MGIDKQNRVPLGDQIKNKRNEKNLTQEQLASKAGISKSTVQGLEDKRFNNTSINTLAFISQALDFYEWDLMLQK